MIVYLDASALVKRYITEAGSAEVERLISQTQVAGT
jgi:predicted nucleic acid-binding protein